jgi:hypothetical protein
VPAVRNFGLKEVSLNQIELQVGFYPFRGPEASLTLAQAYHTARGVFLRCSLSVERFARFWMTRKPSLILEKKGCRRFNPRPSREGPWKAASNQGQRLLAICGKPTGRENTHDCFFEPLNRLTHVSSITVPKGSFE